MSTEQLKQIYDRIFQLRNSMDKQIRTLQDVQKVLNIMEFGFEYIKDDNSEYQGSAVRIMLKYLNGLEEGMKDTLEELSLIEGIAGEVNKDS